MDGIFANPHNAPVHTSTVVVGHQKYLVVGYFDASLPANFNLRPFCPNLIWRGEIAILSLGRRVRVRARPTGTQTEMQQAIFM